LVQRPTRFNRFEFAVLAGLRATQLSRGCLPRVNGSGKAAVTAQMEVAEGKVARQEEIAASVSGVIEEPVPVPAAD